MPDNEIPTLEPDRYDAVIFDLDGVLTRTADLHAKAWKRMFDEYFQRLDRKGDAPKGADLSSFTVEEDYPAHVDGKPRYDGVADLLESRGIELPRGAPDDPPHKETVCGLGNRKNEIFQEVVEDEGVTLFRDGMDLARAAKEAGLRAAVVSSSKNCRPILESAGVKDEFDAIVDGTDAQEEDLSGKPDPDIFLTAARRLGVDPARTVVVEDALSGVSAGEHGHFGLVVGVDRLQNGSHADNLREHGAHVVVSDLQRLLPQQARGGPGQPDRFYGPNERVRSLDEEGVREDWTLVYEGFEPEHEGLREALCTLGNGYFCTRGALPQAFADEVHYPGTYLAGGYNRLTTEIKGREIENEDLVNLPNWLPLDLRLPGGNWLVPREADFLDYRQELDLRRGLLRRTFRFREGERTTKVEERRLVSMEDPHLAAVEVTITPENWSGRMTLRSSLDGTVVNDGVPRYRGLNNKHLVQENCGQADDEHIYLRVRTVRSRLEVSMAARTRVLRQGQPMDPVRRVEQEDCYIGHRIFVEVGPQKPVTVEKVVSLYSSRDSAIAESRLEARKAVRRAGSFDDLLACHARVWEHLWRRFEVVFEQKQREAGEHTEMVLRLYTFHTLQTSSVHTMDLDVGVPSRGWHGEAYRGHVFWDELFIFPTLNYRLPEITRSLLMYRHRRLDEARAMARDAGHKGAMYPWQSGSNGREESQVLHLNPRSGRWIPDNTHLQRHVNAAIAYNIAQYHLVTDDNEFMNFYGAEMFLDIARFWASIAEQDEEDGRFHIRNVVGPDEYHTSYPWSDEPGLHDNAYTNVMAAWVLDHGRKVFDRLPEERAEELRAKLNLDEEELERWRTVSSRMHIPFHDGVISQFRGYEDLEEFDWQGYREKYDSIQRLDRILEAEGDTPNRYKASKQADVLMLFYLFSAEELQRLFQLMGYEFDPQLIPRTIDYYLQRTSHGSTLSSVVHARVLARSDRKKSWELFKTALRSDVSDIQGGTTPEGIHVGAMAGCMDIIQRGYTDLEPRNGVLHVNPCIPEELNRLNVRIRYQDHSLVLEVTSEEMTVTARRTVGRPIKIGYEDKVFELCSGESRTVSLKASSRSGSS